MKKIYIDQVAIKVNERRGQIEKPPIAIEVFENNKLVNEYRAFSLLIDGKSSIKYNPKETNGPRVWIETDASVYLSIKDKLA